MELDVEGIVFDIDDTLYLERDYVRSGFNSVGTWLSAEYGFDGLSETAWNLFQGGVRGSTLQDALARIGAPAELLSECIDLYRKHEPNIGLLPDASSFLARVAGRVPLAVVTDGPAESQRAKCDALGLSAFCEAIVLTAELRTTKPDPLVFQHATDGWGVPPERLVYFADNPQKDFQGPSELGWKAVRVRRAGGLHFGFTGDSVVPEIPSFEGVSITPIVKDVRAG